MIPNVEKVKDTKCRKVHRAKGKKARMQQSLLSKVNMILAEVRTVKMQNTTLQRTPSSSPKPVPTTLANKSFCSRVLFTHSQSNMGWDVSPLKCSDLDGRGIRTARFSFLMQNKKCHFGAILNYAPATSALQQYRRESATHSAMPCNTKAICYLLL